MKNAGLDKVKSDEIVAIPKGSRPDHSKYLSKEFIDSHLSQFDDGLSVIQTEWAYGRYSETKEGTKEVMIYGRKQLNEESNEKYDYVSCFFPEGNIGPEYTFLFNHEDIRKVIFTGYENEEELDYNKQF